MSKQLTFQVLGTKCASCEIVLERELSTMSGVRKVTASHDAGRLTLEVEPDVMYGPADLERVVGKHGYRFEQGSGVREQGTEQFSWKRLGGALVMVGAAYVLLKQVGALAYAPSVESGTTLGAVFVIGLIAAVSSCTAVVSGLIVAVSASSAKRHVDRTWWQRTRPHLLFNLGRLAGFAGFGALIGLLGSVLTLSAQWNGILVVLIALLMIGLGLNLLDVVPPGLFAVKPPKWLSHRIHALSDSQHPGVSFVLGALTFFLPCGFTQSVQLYALSTGDPARAALIMTVFALGTLPALLGIGIATSSVTGPVLKHVSRVAGALVVALGIANMGNGAALLGLVVPPSHASDPTLAPIVDGRQQIQMEVTPYGVYAPDTFIVSEDIPVDWEIFGAKQMGCGSVLVAPAFGVDTALYPGYNQVAFTPTEPGTYVFTCSMGMMRGTMIVKEAQG